MSDRYPVSNQQRSNSSNRQGGNFQRGPLKIGHSVSFRGARTNASPNRTGYDHMYATDTEDGQPQPQQQQVVLTCMNSGSGAACSDTVTTAVSEVHFLKEFLIIHLDLIEQQNEDILQKDNIIINLQQENALLKQRIKALEHHNSASSHIPLSTLNHNTLIPPTELPADHPQQQTAPGDYSPESIPPTEDVLAPDVGDEMTLAEPVVPLSAKIIRNNVTLPTPKTLSATTIQQPVDLQEQPVVANANVLGGACLPEARAEEQSQTQLSSVVNCETRESSEIVVVEDDSTDAEVKSGTDLVQNCDSVVERVEQPTSDIVAGQQPTPIPTEESATVTPSATTDHTAPKAPSTATAVSTATAPTARYSVVRNSIGSDIGEANAKNLRMSIRRKRLCSESSNTDNATASDGGQDTTEAKGRDSITEIGIRGKECSRSKRKCVNGQILTFPQEYVTLVGEANVNVLRHQALAEEVFKAANLEVPHWRVKVYADSYHLEGTENLDDEVFLKRHSRLENDERRRKRWDVQRIREQRIVEKLKQRQTKSQHLNSDHTHSKCSTNGGADGRPDSLDGYETPASLWPAPEHDLQYIEVTDQLPVGAFGVPLPVIIPGEFSIPWLGSEKSQSEFSGEAESPLVEPSTVAVKTNNGRKSRKSGRESSGGGATTKRRSRR